VRQVLHYTIAAGCPRTRALKRPGSPWADRSVRT
jgi:hypothetical protein